MSEVEGGLTILLCCRCCTLVLVAKIHGGEMTDMQGTQAGM
jgi:hypothetical protein